jgi:hypothetical protein
MRVNQMPRKPLPVSCRGFRRIEPRELLAIRLILLIAALFTDFVARAAAQQTSPPSATYWVYVGAESADLIHRIKFGPAGLEVERTIRVGELPAEMEGPHGLQISRDGKYLHMTT